VSSPDLDEKIAQKTRQARIIQLVVIGLVAALFYLREPKDAYAALYGGFVSLFLIWSLTWTMEKATEISKTDAKKGILIAYVSAVIRFILILVFFGVGIGSLGLNPLPLVVTAILVWLIGVIAPGIRKNKE
jgi:ATP synthase protein I